MFKVNHFLINSIDFKGPTLVPLTNLSDRISTSIRLGKLMFVPGSYISRKQSFETLRTTTPRGHSAWGILGALVEQCFCLPTSIM